MSTEKDQRDKDWEAATEFAVNASAHKDLECFTPETCLQIGFRKGIQHARRGERERLVKFCAKLYLIIGPQPYDVETFIDEFLEQEESK